MGWSSEDEYDTREQTEVEVVCMLFTIDILTLIERYNQLIDLDYSYEVPPYTMRIPIDVEDRVKQFSDWLSHMSVQGRYTENSHIEWYIKNVYPQDGSTYPCRNVSQYVHVTDCVETVPIPTTEDELDCLHSSMELGECYKMSCVSYTEDDKATGLKDLLGMEPTDVEGRVVVFQDWIQRQEDYGYDTLCY